MTVNDRTAEFWGQFLHDPIKFVDTFWPLRECPIAPYQAGILRSVAKNTETWVHSAHEMGKSYTASLAALWWFCTRPSKIIIISASESQLRTAIWGDINKLLRTATYQGKPFDFGLVKRDLKLLYPSDSQIADPEHFLWLRPVKEGESIHGAHMPLLQSKQHSGEVGTVFWIFEEGSSIPKVFFEIAATSRHSMLVVGNPTNDDSEYAKICKAGNKKHPLIPGKLFRNVIWISGDDSPNVQVGKKWKALGKSGPPPKVGLDGTPIFIPGILSYPTYLERLDTYSDFDKKTRLFGKFPEEAGHKLFPGAWLQTAQELNDLLVARIKLRGKPIGKPFALGVDSSEGGGDKTAFVVWGRFGIVYVLSKETPKTTEIQGTTLALMRKFGIKPWYVAFDSGGGGKQHADALRDKGYEDITDVDFGSRADDPKKYMNKRAELYGELREAMKPTSRLARMLKTGPARWGNEKLYCASIPSDNAVLKEDLSVLPLLRDSEGRLRILPKERARGKTSQRAEKTLRELLGRSPDQGDAAALAHFAWVRGSEYDEAASCDGPLIYG